MFPYEGFERELVGKSFGFWSTAEEVAAFHAKKRENGLNGDLYIVTGANVGLGLETSRVLAKFGAQVVMCSRDASKGKAAMQEILDSNPEAVLYPMVLDLANLASIETFVKDFEAKFSSDYRLAALINNAGVMGCPPSQTLNGFELQFGTNHLGHFYLTKLLLARLIASGTKSNPSRIVNVSSLANWLFTPVDKTLFSWEDDLAFIGSDYHPWERYGISKLANILFTFELQRRLDEQGCDSVISVSLHPGSIATTRLTRSVTLGAGFQALYRIICGGPSVWKAMIFEGTKSISRGTATTMVATLDPNIVPGAYYSNCQPGSLIHSSAKSLALATSLWAESERLIISKGFNQ